MNRQPSFSLLLSSPLLVAALLSGCKARPPEPESRQATPETGASSQAKSTPPADAAAQATHGEVAAPGSAGDPLKGKLSLDEALVGLTGTGPLKAEIKTDLGALTCDLWPDKAPKTVANFVGLARGLRPYKLNGAWVKRPAYDGTTFHRVVKGFMIQGGDPMGTGAGEPGYVIDDEIWEGSKHDVRGLLCMANRGKNTNGMQFFITDAAAPHLDGGYTIFGRCGPDTVMDKLSSVPTRGDRAVTPPKIERVTISR